MLSRDQLVEFSLHEAFRLGQVYWQEADHEHASQWRKADITKQKFHDLVEQTKQQLKECQR
jgi:hypothetical protein